LVIIVSRESEVEQLRLDLKRLYDWSLDWQMLFNIGKCKSLHFGYRNVKSTYTLGGDIVKVEDEEKDLGIVVNRALKSSSQCAAAAKSANKTLGMISRTFVNRDKKVRLRLYQTLVRPELEYCVQAWRPYLRKDTELLEEVQKRATRLIIKDRGLTYGNE